MIECRICLYSNVPDTKLFSRVGFYRDDIAALSLDGAIVLPTNSFGEIIGFRPQMIISYFYSKSILVALIGRVIGAKIILTGGADQISPILKKGIKLLLHRILAFLCLLFANRILLSCTDDIDTFRALCFGWKYLENKLELVNHVVIPSKLTRQPYSKHARGFNAFTVCWMGAESNIKRKGVDRAVKLIALLRKLGIDASLNIAGSDGPGRKLIENLIKELNLVDRVHLLGAISEDEKDRRFANDDLYLQLSEHEGFGVAAAEAFFSGMIVVHTNRGGLRDVIGRHGMIVDFAMIDNEDLKAISEFYSAYLRYEIDQHFLADRIKNYTIRVRADAFFR